MPSNVLKETKGSPIKKVVASMDLSGVRTNDVKIQFHKGKLYMQAQQECGDTTIIKFDRSFVVNEKKVDMHALQAYLLDGVFAILALEKEATLPVNLQIMCDEISEESKQQTV